MFSNSNIGNKYPEPVFEQTADLMSNQTSRSKTNPQARDADQVLGTAKPNTVSAATWNRPYRYLVVRVDENRLKMFDDHPRGRTFSAGLHTRHNAVGRKAVLKRRNPEANYEILPEENDLYESDK